MYHMLNLASLGIGKERVRGTLPGVITYKPAIAYYSAAAKLIDYLQTFTLHVLDFHTLHITRVKPTRLDLIGMWLLKGLVRVPPYIQDLRECEQQHIDYLSC
jgi:hypothetical protein